MYEHYEDRFVVTNGGVVVGEEAVGYASRQANPRGGALLNYNDLQSDPHLFGGKGKIVTKNKTKKCKISDTGAWNKNNANMKLYQVNKTTTKRKIKRECVY